MNLETSPMKKCNKCFIEKPLDFFEKQSKNSYRNICKQCKNARDHKRKKITVFMNVEKKHKD
jgi:hypothetical protein